MPAASPDARLERLLRRDRAVVLALLAAVAVASWGYTLSGAGMGGAEDAGGMAGMEGMAGMDMGPAPPSPVLLFAMWWAMMTAMMLPAAAPMILLFAAIERRQERRPPVPTALFAASYLLVWGAFGALAAGLQAAAAGAGLLGPDMALGGRTAAGVLLLAAGLYQLTPLKAACLGQCRDPLRFLVARWRPGVAGALRMGLAHGAWCLGCCWALMLLLFVGGVMSPWWIGGLALFVLVEKLVPFGRAFGRVGGLGLVAAGAWLIGAAA